jgi:hypothetical protein
VEGEKKRTVALEDTEDLGTSDTLDLCDTVAVSEDDTDLGRGHTLTGQLEDLL